MQVIKSTVQGRQMILSERENWPSLSGMLLLLPKKLSMSTIFAKERFLTYAPYISSRSYNFCHLSCQPDVKCVKSVDVTSRNCSPIFGSIFGTKNTMVCYTLWIFGLKSDKIRLLLTGKMICQHECGTLT